MKPSPSPKPGNAAEGSTTSQLGRRAPVPIPGRLESSFIPLAPDLDFALAGFNQSLSAAWSGTLKVNCPHCGEVHEISVREVYINGAIEDASERLRRV